jgi:hypothetical protein
VFVLVFVLGTATAKAQQGAYRFEITSTVDSLATIDLGDVAWLAPGMYAIAVDPVHRDELVARLRVKSVQGKTATVVITGQAAPITLQDVVLVEPPKPPKRHWYQQAAVWISLVVGAAIGVAASR